MDRSLYPDNWEAIAHAVKAASGWYCENCGKPCMLPGEDWLDFILRMDWTVGEAIAQRERQYWLTTAHLNHEPRDCSRENLRAWCAPCHCRYDLSQMGTKVMLKREREGQLNWLDPVDRIGLEHHLGGHGRYPGRIQLHLGDIRRVVR